ncbi:MAG: hypothetical protein R2856_15345 [Caldilineaceae bacterium]
MDGRRRTEDELLSLVVRRPSSSPPARKGTPRLHQPRRRRIAAEHNLHRVRSLAAVCTGASRRGCVEGDWGLGTGDWGSGTGIGDRRNCR